MGSLGAMAFFMNSGRVVPEVASIQYGSVTFTAPWSNPTATITSVDTTRSVVVCLGVSANGPAGIGEDEGGLALTNSTTVTWVGGGGSYGGVVSFMVITFSAGSVKSLQDITIFGADGSTVDTATITSVNPTKTAIFKRDYVFTPSANGAGTMDANFYTRVTLTNATTVTKTRSAASVPNGRVDLKITIVEFN